jgi:hypothetical protein
MGIHRLKISLCMPFTIKPILSRCSDLIVAIATIYRPITARFKRYFGVLTTLGALYREHLTTTTSSGVAVGFPCLAAGGTTLRLVGITLSLEKLLFISTKGEGSATIGTSELFVLKTHWMTSFS